MRLSLFNEFELNIVHRRPLPARLGAAVTITDQSEHPTPESPMQAVAEFTLRAQTRIPFDPAPGKRAIYEQQAARVLARVLYHDVREEVLDIADWAVEQGLGDDLHQRLWCLVRLLEGEDVTLVSQRVGMGGQING